MPIYEYRCANCQHQLEALQKLSDSPLTQCPQCEKPDLTKLVSAASFRLKGGGWYETDFKTGNKKQLADSDKASSNAADKPASTAKNDKAAATGGSTQSKSNDKPPKQAKS